MCGIAGAVSLGGDPAILDEPAVRAMADTMRRRGPDGDGFYRDACAVLGHRRLSIIDLAGGAQPMATPDGELVVVQNGEIYNFRALRDRLEALGHRFTTRSDTEAILHAYREWGADCVRELDGMFAFALWDVRHRTLLLARDRFGKKPLYYWRRGGDLVFASTLTALCAHPAVPGELDDAALAEYLALEYVVAPRTIIAGVRKLPPAHALVLDEFDAELRPYWQLRVEGTRQVGEAEAIAELTSRLETAVERRLVSDVPLGVLLSGGIDSSLVTAFAARARAGIETFSVRFDDPSFDESGHARKVAAHLGTTHHEEPLGVATAAGIVSELGDILDEPIGDASIVPTYLLSRFVRRHVTVALGGDGGDELFAGYPTYLAHELAGALGPLRKLARAGRYLADLLPVSHDNFSFDFKLKKLLLGLDAPDDERNYVWLGATPAAQVDELLGGGYDVYAAARARYREGHGNHLERVLYQDVGLYMCHGVLAKVDRAAMAASLEVRAPLLDTAFAEYAASLPQGLKLRGRTTKYILKKLARRYLPHDIVDRPKKGFGMPIGRWLRDDLRGLARDVVLGARSLAASGRVRRDVVERWLREHAEARVDHRQRLWTLLVLELWRQRRRA
ncbi:MAG TPA: asparagine synthase (glutamine-hydrolyzing) [Kofleriaceae bacterium]|nr:asparagine synthase (glutamine-hydrolyzing) [Kofleriaceae bacterium]